MRYYFKRFFVLHSLEVIFSFLIKKSRQKAIEIETAIFHPLGNPKGRTLDHFFYASHICHKFPYKLSFRSEASTYGLTCSGDGDNLWPNLLVTYGDNIWPNLLVTYGDNIWPNLLVYCFSLKMRRTAGIPKSFSFAV